MHQFKGWIFSAIRNPLHSVQGQSILKVTTVRKPGKLRLRKCSQVPYNSNGGDYLCFLMLSAREATAGSTQGWSSQ